MYTSLIPVRLLLPAIKRRGSFCIVCRRQNPDAVIALTGCFPQAFPERALQMEEADIIRGARDRLKLLDDVQAVLSSGGRIHALFPHERGEAFESMAIGRFHERTRAFVKIEDGCDKYCSYCIIPKARGPIRSKPLKELESELRTLSANGYREIVLVGINLSSYGRELGCGLTDAVELACSVPGIERVRLGSLEPELLSDGDLMRPGKAAEVCPRSSFTSKRLRRDAQADEPPLYICRVSDACSENSAYL